MAITTYAELKTALGNWSVRTDLTSFYDDFIDQTESFFDYAPLRPSEPGIGGIRNAITRATGTLTAATLAQPTGFQEPLRFYLTGPNGGLVEYISAEQMKLAFRTGTGKPKFWTVTDVIEFDVDPSSDYAYEFTYLGSVTALSDTNTSNAILAGYPNVYLSGCMFNLNIFIHDDVKADRWLTQYKSGAHAANKSYQRSRHSQGAIAAKVA